MKVKHEYDMLIRCQTYHDRELVIQKLKDFFKEIEIEHRSTRAEECDAFRDSLAYSTKFASGASVVHIQLERVGMAEGSD